MSGAGRLIQRSCSSYSIMITVVLALDLVLNAGILKFARYTEIDWQAYMDQVSLFMGGERHYSELKGVTGPLVYPAGFVYLFSGLFHTTDGGTNIPLAQLIFSAIYMAVLGLCCAIYAKAAPQSFQPVWLVLLCVSKRIHSIFLLRLFNDGPAMLLLYTAVLCFVLRRWRVGCVFFSVAVSVKMNIFLFAPGLGLIMLIECGLFGMMFNIGLCVLVQVLLAAPFLATSVHEYMDGAFNFSRTFKHKWSVNFKWVPCEPTQGFDFLVDCQGPFTSAAFSRTLIVLLLSTLLCFCHFKWCAKRGGLVGVLKAGLAGKLQPKLTAHEIVTILFSCNFIGVVFSRSLHFQFYVWYYHSLPFLLWCCKLPTAVRLLLIVLIEAAWNPWHGETSSVGSSALLTLCHGVMLIALWFGNDASPKVTQQINKP